MPRNAFFRFIFVLPLFGLMFFSGCSEKAAPPKMTVAPATLPPAGEIADASPLNVAPPVAAPTRDPNAAAAVVNGVTITEGVIHKEMLNMAKGRPLPPGAEQYYRPQVLERAIQMEVLRQFGKEHNVEIPEASITARITELEERYETGQGQDHTVNSLDERLAAYNMTRDDLHENIHDDLLFNRVFSEYVKPASDEMIREFYDENKSHITAPTEVVRVSHILFMTVDPNKPNPENGMPQSLPEEVKAEKLKQAQEVLEKIHQGADFAEMAQQFSEDNPGGNGDLGYTPHGRWVKSFESAAFGTKVGDVTGPIESEYGYHIIKVTGRREKGIIPFDDPDLPGEIKNNLFESKRQNFIEDLMSKATIVRVGEKEEPPPIMISPEEIQPATN